MANAMKLTWYEISYNGNSQDTTKKKIERKLRTQSAKEALADLRTVYVIRSEPPFAFAYSLRPSPVVYIGKGNFWNRLSQSHSRWIKTFHERIGLRFSIQFCRPRRQKSESAYENVEADLIHMFVDKFGTLPLMNSRKEWPDKEYSYSKWSSRPALVEVDDQYFCSLQPFDGLFNLEEA